VTHEYPGAPVVGVGGVIVKDGRAIVIKRANEPYKGQWSIPGGRVELGESLIDAVRREMREETGLHVSVGPVIEVFERIQRVDQPARESASHPGGVQYHFVIIDYLCMCDDGALCAGDDADDARWVTSEELDQYDIRESAKAVIRKGLAMAHERADG
jgi:ADP-ribose pyrophosphatase YjhB (NUDIX family)